MEAKQGYEIVVGLEVHARLLTKANYFVEIVRFLVTSQTQILARSRLLIRVHCQR